MKQNFLNTVYEKFFQGFSIKVTDTRYIVYDPTAQTTLNTFVANRQCDYGQSRDGQDRTIAHRSAIAEVYYLQ